MSAKAKQTRDDLEVKLIACKRLLVVASQATPLLKRSVTKKRTKLADC